MGNQILKRGLTTLNLSTDNSHKESLLAFCSGGVSMAWHVTPQDLLGEESQEDPLSPLLS